MHPHLQTIPRLRTFTTRKFFLWFSESWWASELVLSGFFSFVPLWSSQHIPSPKTFFTLKLVRVILIHWITTSHSTDIFLMFFKRHGCSVASWQTCASARANSGESGTGAQTSAVAATASSSQSSTLLFRRWAETSKSWSHNNFKNSLLQLLIKNKNKKNLWAVITSPESLKDLDDEFWSFKIFSQTGSVLLQLLFRDCFSGSTENEKWRLKFT